MKNIIICTFVLASAGMSAQISGTLRDKDGQPRANMPIRKKGTEIRTRSSQNGDFKILAGVGDTLIIGNTAHRVGANPFNPVISSKESVRDIQEIVMRQNRLTDLQAIRMDREDINVARGSSNAELFNGVPGLQVNNIRNEAGALDIGIRGLQGEGRVPILIDGSLQSAHTDRGYQGSSDRTYIEMDLVQAVNVNKGATFNKSATGASGGVIEMKTIDAADIVKPGNSIGVLVKATMQNNGMMPHVAETEKAQQSYVVSNGIKEGSFQNGSATVALGYVGKKIDILAALSLHRQGNIFAGKKGAERYDYDAEDYGGWPVIRPGQEIVNTSYASQSSLMKLGWQMTPEQNISFKYRYHYQRAGEVLAAYWDKSIKTDPQTGEQQDIMAQWTTGTTIMHNFSADYRFLRGRLLDLSVSVFANIGKFNQHNGLPVFATQGSYGDQYLHEYENNRLGAVIMNKNSFNIPFPLNISYGINIQEERNYPIRPRIKKMGAARNAERTTQSIFAGAEAKLAKFNFNLNLSRDYANVVDYSYDRNIYYGNKLSTILRAEYHPIRQISLTAKGYSIYKAPSLYESTGSNQSFNYDPAYPLKQENTRGAEAGLAFNFAKLIDSKDQMNFGINAFYNETRDFTSAAVFMPQYQFSFINYDRFTLKGLELTAGYDHPEHGYVTASAVFYDNSQVCSQLLGQAYEVDKCTSEGFAWSLLPTRIPPRRSMMINAGIYALNQKLTLGGTLKYHSRKEVPADWLAGTGAQGVVDKLPDATFVNVFGGYKIGKTIKLSAAVDNLLDTYAIDAGAVIQMPVPGRTIRIGIESNF